MTMKKTDSQVNIADHDDLSHTDDSSATEKIRLLQKLKKRFNFELNGLFYIILSVVVLAISLTIAMVLCIFYGPPQIQPHAGISTEVSECSAVGLEICRRSGSAVDSAIGSSICLTVIRPDIVSLGGCGSMLIHNHSSMASEIIDFSCVSPPNPSTAAVPEGAQVKAAVAIPGILSGLKMAHNKYGRMKWETILQIVIDQLLKGVQVTSQMRSASSSPQFNNLSANFKILYANWTVGSIFVPPNQLIGLMRTLQSEGADSGLTGSIAKEIVSLGFLWTGQFDTARTQKTLKALFGDFSVMTAPLPSKGGLDLVLTVDILNKLIKKDVVNKDVANIYHLILESLKVVQASTSFLGDSNYGTEGTLTSPSSVQSLMKLVNITKTQTNDYYGPYYRLSKIENQSGSHISVIDNNNLYVSLSLNMGSKFGSGIATSSGILLNDAMRLFTPTGSSTLVPGLQSRNSTSSNNIAASGKRPLNQLTPLVVYNIKRKCGIRFAVGGDHGSRSITGSLQMILSAIFIDQTFCPNKDCVELQNAGVKPRLHADILDNYIANITARLYVESSFPAAILKVLTKSYQYNNSVKVTELQSLYSIGKVQYEIKGFADNRGGGKFVYF